MVRHYRLCPQFSSIVSRPGRRYRLCPYMVQNLLDISLFLYSWPWFCITSLSPFLWCTQGSILGPILFNMYTTPLGTIISSRSLNHQLYADDTQIFISFAPKTCITAVSQLQDTNSDISSWMTAKLLSLNLSKTEFMLVGLPQQIYKISSPSLFLPPNHPITPIDSTRNLGFIFDSGLTFSNKFRLYRVLATITSTAYAASGTLSTSKQHLLSLLILYILKQIIVTHFT